MLALAVRKLKSQPIDIYVLQEFAFSAKRRTIGVSRPLPREQS